MSYQKIRVYDYTELKDRFIPLNDVLENYKYNWDNYESLDEYFSVMFISEKHRTVFALLDDEVRPQYRVVHFRSGSPSVSLVDDDSFNSLENAKKHFDSLVEAGWLNYATAQKYGNYHNETITLYYKNTILKREVF